MALGPTDKRILSLLQTDARMTNQTLADEIGLSPSPCWRKVRKLEEDGGDSGLSRSAQP